MSHVHNVMHQIIVRVFFLPTQYLSAALTLCLFHEAKMVMMLVTMSS